MKLTYALFSFCILLLAAPQAQAAPPSFEDLAEKLLPTVVNISTTSTMKAVNAPGMPGMPELMPGSPFEDFFKDFYDRFNRPDQPRKEQKASALGSGFVIDAKAGHIVTNAHVVKGAEEIKVILHDDTTLDATLVGLDEKTDLAVLQVKNTRKLVSNIWGDSDQARVGSWVMAIGNPFGLGGTVTAGIVSARQRNINAGPYDDFIQTDASINRGNSGGPMFNLKGEVIGVNTAIFSPSGGSVGIGFAVPSNLAKNIVAQLIKYGTTRRGWLGVRIQEVTPEIAESLGMKKPQGALVSGLSEDGPSDKAGVKSGDVILSFDGHEIEQMRQLPRLVAETEVGRKVTLTLWRQGKEKTLQVHLGQLETAEENILAQNNAQQGNKASPALKAEEVPALGLSVLPIDTAARKKYDIPSSINGLLVAEVDPEGPAADKGLAVGDVITEADQKEIGKPSDLKNRIEATQKAKRSSILLFVARGDNRRFVAVKLQE